MQRFAHFPLLRLLIPFVIGILWCLYFPNELLEFEKTEHDLFLLLICIVVLFVLLIVQWYFNIKNIISVFIDLVLVLFGYELTYYQDLNHHKDFLGNKVNPSEYQYLIAKPSDVVIHKNEYNQLIFDTYKVFNKVTKQWEQVTGKILVRASNQINLDSIYRVNGYYLLHIKLKSITKTKNSYAFNYAEYLKRQGIYYMAYLNQLSDLKFLTEKNFRNIKDWALLTRYKIIEYFRNNQYLDKVNQPIAIAFLTGFDDELDKEIIQQFASSGTLHILSVSGFHTGLIFLLVSFLFSLADPYKKRRWLRVVSVVFILFFYAFVSGFSAPIVRAALMLSLIVVHQYFYTDRIVHPLNILSAAAFFVLVYNPLFINDAGFLLSFSAMAGIVYFSPKYYFDNRVLQSIWDIVSMSIGAQIGTLPVALYFFHSFAFLFLLANILIIPLSTIIMFLCLGALIPISFISSTLNFFIKVLLYLNEYFYLSNTYYDKIHFNFTDALMLLILIIGLSMIIDKYLNKETHWIKIVNFTALVLSIWIVVHHIQYLYSYQKTSVYVYADKTQPLCWIQKQNKITFNTIDSSSFDFWTKNLLLKNCIESYQVYPFNYIIHQQRKILICHQLQDTLLIKQIQPNIIIWHNKKALNWKNLNWPHLQKIYWLNKGNYSMPSISEKISLLHINDVVEL